MTQSKRTYTIDPPMFARKTYEVTIWAAPLGDREIAKRQFQTRKRGEAWARNEMHAKTLIEQDEMARLFAGYLAKQIARRD